MTAQVKQIQQVLPLLTKAEQKELLLYLVNLVVVAPEAAEDDFELSPEWEAEIERRIKRVESGESKAIPIENVLAKYGL